MNCKNCLAELEDFLYGELSDERSAAIKAHLASCHECSAARREIESENEIFAQFYERTALEPDAGMWEAIRSRIDPKPHNQEKRSRGWLANLLTPDWFLRPAFLRQAAFAILLVALSVAATTFFLRRDGDNHQNIVKQNDLIAPATSPLPSPSPLIDVAEVQPAPATRQPVARRAAPQVKQLSEGEMVSQQIGRAEREYRNAIRMLGQAVAKRKDSFDPELFKQYESSLALIDNSIASSRRALRERPDDLVAGQFLLTAYSRKVELMQDFAMR